MTPMEQRRFVWELIGNVREDILTQHERWPPNWDGHELRALVAIKFADVNHGLCSERKEIGTCHEKARRRRLKAFKNDLIINDL